MIFTMSVYSDAVGDGIYTYEFGNVDVIFDENTQFSETERMDIVALLVSDNLYEYNGNIAHPENIICTIFGHNYTTEVVIAITHNVRDTQPTCLEETYEVSICSRCDNIQSELIGTKYIYCTDH